jgi:hypothetical protein
MDRIPVPRKQGDLGAKLRSSTSPWARGGSWPSNFDPIHRYQTESDFRLVWNAILNWNDLAGPPAEPWGST